MSVPRIVAEPGGGLVEAAGLGVADGGGQRGHDGDEEDQEFVTIRNQLEVMGLTLREIEGDG